MERISRRAVVRAGETAAELLETTKKLQIQMVGEFDRLSEEFGDLKDDIKNDYVPVEAYEHDIDELNDEVKDLATEQDKLHDRLSEAVRWQMARDAEFRNFTRHLTFWQRISWLFFGEGPLFVPPAPAIDPVPETGPVAVHLPTKVK